MPLQATSGAASYDAFGGGVAAVPQYIEDVFQTWLYTGNGSTQTITNGIDLAGKGGLVWAKGRTTLDGPAWNILVDTARGVSKNLSSNATNAQFTASTVTSFNANGFALGDPFEVNQNAASYASWTFREQPKFFDVVTYTGTGSVQNIAHSLGSVPGCIIVKRVTSDGNWQVYHRSTGNNKALQLNDTGTGITGTSIWNDTDPTSTVFTVGSFSEVNQSGQTFVAYVFAHNAGGFGLTGTDNVISCGSYVGTGGGTPPQINLGFEPQWILLKNTVTGPWELFDTMRGISLANNNPVLLANTSGAEITNERRIFVNATGFFPNNTGSAFENENGSTYIYIAIRRGPMKVPTDPTKVFAIDDRQSSTGSTPSWQSNFVTDFALNATPSSAPYPSTYDRLRGGEWYLETSQTAAENGGANIAFWQYMNGYGNIGSADSSNLSWMMQRAPSFMDVVCYTGTGSNRTLSHNLGVVPELMIVKSRSGANDWAVYSSAVGNTKALFLNTTATPDTWDAYWNDTTPTSSVFTVGTGSPVNQSSVTYVAYLFATCPGVSKVGSYTGTGSTQTISCGFTGGARFVLIKRTNSTGNWWVWDTYRGMVSGTDPRFALNLRTTSQSNANWVYTTTGGFEIVTSDASVNASGGNYIFLAIA